MSELRIPPGRAGRLWLLRRLEAARLAADLLDRKLRILHGERERLRARARDTGAAWQAAWRAADDWGLRVALQGGRRELRLAAARSPCDVDVTWTTVMGLRYPVTATCRAAGAPVGGPGPGTAATVEAATAYRQALAAAAAHAAASAAHRVVSAEVAATRRRRRAVTQRWIPRLERALGDLNQRLEEAERAEGVRMRYAAAPAPAAARTGRGRP
ncbi:V-type ATP synthase subunit D [Plantactinospora sp. WMMB334]|uniref:V-type ATP synthase subunit D n=1 Tax=Plantactinospora sp. WMMB334 TaxID=3404119 RepID=UPI003B961B26